MIKLRNIMSENSIFVPRRSREERAKSWKAAIYKQIQAYIRNGSNGDLDLSESPVERLPDNLKHVGGYLWLFDTKITSLPNNLHVGDSLYLANTPLARKYTKEQIKAMVPGVKGSIYK